MRLLAACAVLCCLGCRYEASFKGLELTGVEFSRAFSICHSVVVRHYNGVYVRVDPANGKIETDPVEFTTENGLRREKVFVKLEALSENRLRVELFALMYEPVLDPSRPNPYEWQPLGSDGQQEKRLLDEIAGEILRVFPSAEVAVAGS